MLAYHQNDREDRSFPVAGDRPHLLDDVPESLATIHTVELFFQLPLHLKHLRLNIWMLFRQLAHIRQSLTRLLPSIRPRQPPWRFIAEQHPNEQERGWETLHCERHLPLAITGDVQFTPVVDPESNHGPHRLEKLVQSNQHPSRGSWCVLRDIRRRQHRRSAQTQTFDEASSVQSSQVAGTGGLHHASETCEESRSQKSWFTAPFVGARVCDQCSKESTALHDGDDVGAEICVGKVGVFTGVAEGVFEGWESDDAADDADVLGLSSAEDDMDMVGGLNYHAEECPTKARRTSEEEDTEVVDLRRINFHGIVAHDAREDAEAQIPHLCDIHNDLKTSEMRKKDDDVKIEGKTRGSSKTSITPHPCQSLSHEMWSLSDIGTRPRC